MKQLQNNFTTPEQSKRLLELGVPTDSADCYLLRTHTQGDTFLPKILHGETYSELDKFTNMLEYLPCWSVGRLMEIVDICDTSEVKDEWPRTEELVENFDSITEYLVHTIEFMRDKLDFSKLEE